MVCKAFLESSNFVRTVMKSLTANQQALHFIYFLLKSGCPQDGRTGTWLKPCMGLPPPPGIQGNKQRPGKAASSCHLFHYKKVMLARM